jgi:hypothetical protein
MLRLTLILLLAGSPSSQPASQPLTMPTLSVCALGDAACWKRSTLQLYDFAQFELKLAQELQEHLTIETDSVGVFRQVVVTTGSALTQSLQTIDDLKNAAGPHWYLSPYLWFAVGMVVTAAAIGVGAALVHQLAH